MYTISVIDLYSGESNPRSRDIQFHKDTITIGRSGDNDLVLRQTNVSTKHASISLTSQGFFLEDLRSTNGTFVNKSQVTSAVRIFSDDRIEMGGTVLSLSGHPALNESSQIDAPIGPANDPFPFDEPPSKPVPSELPIPQQGGMNQVSLDSIFPEERSSRPSSDPFYSGSNTGSGDPFPLAPNATGFPLPPEDKKPKADLVDKIKSLESKLIHKKAEKMRSLPPSAPLRLFNMASNRAELQSLTR